MREDYGDSLAERELYMSTIREELENLSDEISADIPTENEDTANNEQTRF